MKKLMFKWNLGILVKKAVIGAICDYCINNGYELNFSECRGWISSIFYITIELPESEIPKLKHFMKQLEEE